MLKNLINETKEKAISYGSLPFWSWNDKLKEAELRRQIGNMHALGMNGFFMHARGGLMTEYMSDEWFSAIHACIDEAKKLGMEAWSYDENGWPSGFAGGKLLKDPENLARYLKYTVEDKFPGDALAVYVLRDNKATRIDASCDSPEYHVLRVGVDETYVDILNRDVIAKFISETHEVYKERIGEDFGGAMPGFFTDEPQYYRYATPWSTILADRFMARFGYDIMDDLPALFIECENYKTLRYDYHRLIADLYLDAFIKQLYDWCEQKGCRLTGHTIMEETLAGQLSCCGSAMRFYEYEHIPGIDWLGRPLRTDALPRQLGSACAQLGKKKAITETFAMCGWDVSPRELKNIADLQYAGGVNMMCQHLYTYSCRGVRKLDYPIHFSEYLPWQKHLREFNEYYNNLGYILSRGEENVRTLVIHPIHTAYMYYVREREATIKKHDEAFRALSDRLSELQLAYHYGDEDIMREHASVRGASICVGECVYDRILLPEVETLDESTAALLRQYLANGGKLILMGKKPTLSEAREADYSWLSGNMSFDELLCEAAITIRDEKGEYIPDIRVMGRMIEGKKLFFITNVRKKFLGGIHITVKDCNRLVKLDPRDLTTSAVHGESRGKDFTMLCNLCDSESFILAESDAHAPLSLADFCPSESPFFLPPAKMSFSKKPINTMTLDTVSYSTDGEHFSAPMPLMALRNKLLYESYRGKLTLRMTFEITEKPRELFLALEAMPYLSLRLDGKDVTYSERFFLERCMKTADITSLVTCGRNTLEYEIDYYQSDYVHHVLFDEGVSETLRNCLVYDTELAECYLFGDFAVRTEREAFTPEKGGLVYRGHFALASQKDSLAVENITTEGYPFFSGEMALGFTHIHREGAPTTLRLRGRYGVCEVLVNGETAGTLLFEDDIDLSSLLRIGENRIELCMIASNRNLLGPLHSPEVEPLAVGPKTFTCYPTWTADDTSPMYTPDRYCFVRFGLDCEKK